MSVDALCLPWWNASFVFEGLLDKSLIQAFSDSDVEFYTQQGAVGRREREYSWVPVLCSPTPPPTMYKLIVPHPATTQIVTYLIFAFQDTWIFLMRSRLACASQMEWSFSSTLLRAWVCLFDPSYLLYLPRMVPRALSDLGAREHESLWD